MSQLTVRGLDPDLVAALKARAQRNGRSAEAEHRMILREVLAADAPKEDFWEKARKLREKIGPATDGGPDSTEIIRQMRDERWG